MAANDNVTHSRPTILLGDFHASSLGPTLSVAQNSRQKIFRGEKEIPTNVVAHTKMKWGKNAKSERKKCRISKYSSSIFGRNTRKYGTALGVGGDGGNVLRRPPNAASGT